MKRRGFIAVVAALFPWAFKKEPPPQPLAKDNKNDGPAWENIFKNVPDEKIRAAEKWFTEAYNG